MTIQDDIQDNNWSINPMTIQDNTTKSQRKTLGILWYKMIQDDKISDEEIRPRIHDDEISEEEIKPTMRQDDTRQQNLRGADWTYDDTSHQDLRGGDGTYYNNTWQQRQTIDDPSQYMTAIDGSNISEEEIGPMMLQTTIDWSLISEFSDQTIRGQSIVGLYGYCKPTLIHTTAYW